MKRAMETTMEAGAKGIKIQLAGRLGGAEMARREKSNRRLDAALDAAGQDRLRLYRSRNAAGQHRRSSVDQPRHVSRGRRPMALMPKRVKHRKSQRGRIRGNATPRQPRRASATSASGHARRLAQCADDRGRSYRRPAVPAHRRPAVRPRVSAQIDHLDSAWKPAWVRERENRSFGPP